MLIVAEKNPELLFLAVTDHGFEDTLIVLLCEQIIPWKHPKLEEFTNMFHISQGKIICINNTYELIIVRTICEELLIQSFCVKIISCIYASDQRIFSGVKESYVIHLLHPFFTLLRAK